MAESVAGGVRRILRLSGGISSESGAQLILPGYCAASPQPLMASQGWRRVEDPWLEGWFLGIGLLEHLIDFVEGWDSHLSICVELAVFFFFRIS